MENIRGIKTLEFVRALSKIAKDESKPDILRLEASRLAMKIIDNFEKWPSEEINMIKKYNDYFKKYDRK